MGYDVDPLGRRLRRYVDSQQDREWVYDNQGRLIGELRGNGEGAFTLHARFVYATRRHVPDLMVWWGVDSNGWRIARLVHDVRGSVRLVVDVNGGQVLQALSYDPYGQLLSESNPGFEALWLRRRS